MAKSITVILRDGGEYEITKEQIEYWQMIYPDLDIVEELHLLKELWTVGVIPRKTANSINKYINKYLFLENGGNYESY